MCSHVIARYIALQERCVEAISALGMSDRQSFIYILTNSVNTVFYTGVTAIEREKQITGGSRQKKIDLVNSLNPDWHDLSDDL